MSVHPTAIVDDRAQIDRSAVIGPYVVIDGPVRIGADVRIAPYVHIMGETEIEAGGRIHTGAVVGGPPQDMAYGGEQTYCRIGEGTILREHVTVHRGTETGSTTVVGQRCFLMAGSHVGHNCLLGDEVVLANAVLLAGHVHVDHCAFIGGAAVVHQFTRIGTRAMIAGNARVLKDIPPFMLVDVEGHVAGVNVVGIRRAHFSSSEREEVKLAYHTLYRSAVGFTKAVEQLKQTVQTSIGREILAFVTSESNRGFAQGSRNGRGRHSERE